MAKPAHPDWLILGFDVEAAGQSLMHHHLVQVGVALIHGPTETVWDRWSSYVAPQPGQRWEPRCVTEFWEKNPEIYRAALEGMMSAPPIEEVGAQFRAFIRGILTRYDFDSVKFLVDTASFDGARLELLMGEGSLAYPLDDGRYKWFDMSGSFYEGVARLPPCTEPESSKKAVASALGITWPDWNIAHTHRADEDAALMALQFAHVSNTLMGTPAPATRMRTAIGAATSAMAASVAAIVQGSASPAA